MSDWSDGTYDTGDDVADTGTGGGGGTGTTTTDDLPYIGDPNKYPGFDYNPQTGTYTRTQGDGSTVEIGADGSLIRTTGDTYGTAKAGLDAPAIDKLAQSLPEQAWNAIKSAFTKKTPKMGADGKPIPNEFDESVDWKALAAAGGGIAGLASNLMNKNNPQPITGYQGKIPTLNAVQQQVPGTYDPTRRPGSSGQRYFTDMKYAAPSDAAAAQTAAGEQTTGLAGLNASNPAAQKRPVAESQTAAPTTATAAPASSVIDRLAPTAQGLASLQKAKNVITPTEKPTDEDWKIPNLNKNSAPTDIMAAVKAANPNLDWSKYNPDKMTMDYDEFSKARDDYMRAANPTFNQNKESDMAKAANAAQNAQSGGISTLTPPNQPVAQPAAPVDLMRYNDWVTSSLNPYANNTKVNKSDPYFNVGQYQHYGNYLSDAFADTKKNYSHSVDASGALTDPKYIELINNSNKYGQEARDLNSAYQKTVDWGAIPVAAHGGLINYASGGGITALKGGNYLSGSTDGMADKLPANIEGNQEARLSHGEFVIPADVVSHLGNGNSDAGADRLYSMMDKIRKARTGTKQQGKQINPNKFLPGGSVGYAGGGDVKHFVVGGVTPPANAIGAESNLSNWAGDYVTNMLGKGQALADQPYQGYSGPLTAGASAGQTAAFQGAAGLNVPTSQMGAFTPQTFTADQAQNYMNPYLSAALNPQMEEMRRQSQLNLQPNMAKLTQAGGYGGSRQALMNSEANRNLLQEQNKTLGQGYQTAFDKAMGQFNTEQNRGLEAQSATNAYGLQALSKQAELGGQQRDIEQQGITADRAQFEEEKQDPYKKLTFQQSLLQGLPVQAQSNQYAQPSLLNSLAGGATTIAQLYDILFPQATTTTAPGTTPTTTTVKK